MPRRNRKGVEIKYPEIAVFAFSKGSQMNKKVHKGQSYFYMLKMIDTLMRTNNVVSRKVGISGYKEDVAAYLALLVEVYLYNEMELEMKEDINEYDPDVLPNNFYKRS